MALGEAGLDYFYQHGSRQAQERGFRAHIAAARATGLPLVIHTRDADEDCGRDPRRRDEKGSFRAVLHCFTGGRELAMNGASARASISFRRRDLQERRISARDRGRDVPLERMLVETDAPFLRRRPSRQADTTGLRRRHRARAR